jgi:hypothetical protein
MTPMNFDPVYVEIWNPNDMAINPKFFNNWKHKFSDSIIENASFLTQ